MMRNMDLEMVAVLLLLAFSFHGEAGVGSSGLSFNFYDESCPQLENIVRAGVGSLFLADPTTPAALLRLMFHDCQVQGCDASILLDPDAEKTHYSEITSSKNFGIRKRNSISLIKSIVEAVCPGQVSCADILVLSAREGVALSGGPGISVPLGRRDSSNPPDFRLADTLIPPADIGVDGVLQLFSENGMTVEETVAILGAHTLGITHCLSLESRTNATNPAFANTLKMSCRLPLGFVQNDLTPLLFDNHYFVNSMSGGGVLRIDAEMALDSRTRALVHKFADDEEAFFRAFSSAFVKLSSSNVLTGNEGVIRSNCKAAY
ncbi:peroxidase 29 [Sesamum indicum]|uniref:Peroxidase n=1 Tax=Sesamum indicum TaxID=4182 RepID=A0A6I9UZV3_SESIN|nr:peroxidase 29 [Sesamum indicum]